MRLVKAVSCVVSILFVAGCGSDEPKTPLFEAKPECMGESIVPLQGQNAMVISDLEIGELEDGFDLDHDGEPDNKLAAVGSLARSSIEDSFENFSIVIPLEFFDFQNPGVDECVKFAIYLGAYRLDLDKDGGETADDRGDCNDHDDKINKGAAEVPDNYKDDNCDGNADETIVTETTDAGTTMMVVKSTNTDDMDQDGVTIADGDCDDTNPMVKGPTMAEICGDGYDNDCDGNADYGLDENMVPVCNPYDGDADDKVALDPLGFNSDGTPKIAFTSGTVTMVDGKLVLEAGPSLFSVNIPVTDDLNLDLRISGATIIGDIVQTPTGWALVNARLGGVIDANTADKITGLDVPEIGLTETDTLLDATFANILGPILALPTLPDDFKCPEGVDCAGCRTPDIDVDQDGLEAFCDSNPLDETQNVDVCIDGNGEAVFDQPGMPCTEARDADGNLRFVDGISVEMNFNTVPTQLPATLPPLN
jgi:hypothetical protein